MSTGRHIEALAISRIRSPAGELGMARLRCRTFWRKLAAITLLMAGPLSTDSALAAGRVLFRFEDGQDFEGQVQKATIDRHGVAWIATYGQLFRVEHGRPQLVESSRSNERLLSVASGGERYAWLDSRIAPYGQFAIELFDLNRPGTMIAELESADLPRGFGALRFGQYGQSIVGVTALQDAEGLGGDFRYSFWNGDGQFRDSIVVSGRRISILGENGESLLLIGESSADSYVSKVTHGSKVTQLWSVKGVFRKGVLETAGQIALLNPARQIDEVHVIQSGKVIQVLKFPAPVHDLAITPDGSRGVVATGDGELKLIELHPRTISVRRLPRLSILSRYYVTAIRFINRDSVAVGVIQFYGQRPFERFYGGAVQVLKISGVGPFWGEQIFETAISQSEPTTWSPALDVAYGSDTFAAYTPEAAIFVTIQ